MIKKLRRVRRSACHDTNRPTHTSEEPVFASLIALLIPALSALDGHGRPGLWTATNILCSHNGCNEVGTFVSADGSEQRTRASLRGGSDPAIGQSIAAVEADGGIYPSGGGGAWWHDLIGVIVAGLVGAAWVWTFPVRVLRRRLRHSHTVAA
jgi:hypothetical protein